MVGGEGAVRSRIHDPHQIAAQLWDCRRGLTGIRPYRKKASGWDNSEGPLLLPNYESPGRSLRKPGCKQPCSTFEIKTPSSADTVYHTYTGILIKTSRHGQGRLLAQAEKLGHFPNSPLLHLLTFQRQRVILKCVAVSKHLYSAMLVHECISTCSHAVSVPCLILLA